MMKLKLWMILVFGIILPVVFTVPKLVLCVDFVWEEGSEDMAWVSENFLK